MLDTPANSPFLDGKMLIAMPGMGDPRFERSVVFICAHSDQGAMGLIVNKSADVRFGELLDQLDIDAEAVRRDMAVHFGGPVETGRGFVLHSDDYQSEISTLSVCDGFAMTATLDILEDIARGEGPERAMMALGYAGWGPGQLEHELLQNGWLTVDACASLVFDMPDPDKWEGALALLGVDALALSSTAGHA